MKKVLSYKSVRNENNYVLSVDASGYDVLIRHFYKELDFPIAFTMFLGMPSPTKDTTAHDTKADIRLQDEAEFACKQRRLVTCGK